VKIIKLFILTLFVMLYADNNTSLFSQVYLESTQEHLYEKFDYISDIESMDCNSYSNPTICRFNSKYSAHLGSIIAILVISFFLISGLIGRNPDHDGADSYGGSGISLSEKKKTEINARPIYWGWAIFVFVAALYMIKHIRSDDNNKIIDFTKQALIIEDRESNQLYSYPLKELKTIEILKYTDEDYIHYELNFHFEDKRINLYANKDDLHCCIAAKILSDKLDKPVVKIRTEF